MIPEGAGYVRGLLDSTAPGMGRIVACRKCGSARQTALNGELTLSHTDIKSVALAPVYVCNQLLVCLECGFAELTIPGPDLDNLRNGPISTRSV